MPLDDDLEAKTVDVLDGKYATFRSIIARFTRYHGGAGS
jgi:hypothetical protein